MLKVKPGDLLGPQNIGSLYGKTFLVTTRYRGFLLRDDPRFDSVERLIHSSGRAELLMEDGSWQSSALSNRHQSIAFLKLLNEKATHYLLEVLE